MESEELVLVDLADWLAENWEDGVRYVLGPGSTLHGLARNLGLETTLLGVDVLENGAVIARDVDEARLFELVDGHPAYLLVTAIGGQGHVIGRGNQQISPRVLRAIGLERMRVVATKRKLGPSGPAVAGRQRRPGAGRQLPGRHPGLGRLQGRTAVSAGIREGPGRRGR